MSFVIDLARGARGSFAFMVAAAMATGSVAACNEPNSSGAAGTSGGEASSAGTPGAVGASGSTSGGAVGTSGGLSGGGATAGGLGGSGAAGAGLGAAPGGGTTTGGASSGGGTGGVGGSMPHPPCGDVAPVDGQSCGAIDYACIYDDCPGAGTTRAGCVDGRWHVRTRPCCPTTPPATGDACEGGDEYYYRCAYDGCPGAAFTIAMCNTGTWGVASRPCCPDEPPAYEGCGWNPQPNTGTALQYYCVYQDCAGSGYGEAVCTYYNQLGGGYSGACAPFSCSSSADGPLYCGAGQVCLVYGGFYECVDNPCPPGVVQVGCLQSVCGSAAVDVRPGPYVYCDL